MVTATRALAGSEVDLAAARAAVGEKIDGAAAGIARHRLRAEKRDAHALRPDMAARGIAVAALPRIDDDGGDLIRGDGAAPRLVE